MISFNLWAMSQLSRYLIVLVKPILAGHYPKDLYWQY